MTDSEIIEKLQFEIRQADYFDRAQCDGVDVETLRGALRIIECVSEKCNKAVIENETLNKLLEIVRAERAANVKAYINAVTAFESEKQKGERLLKGVMNVAKEQRLDGAPALVYSAAALKAIMDEYLDGSGGAGNNV